MSAAPFQQPDERSPLLSKQSKLRNGAPAGGSSRSAAHHQRTGSEVVDEEQQGLLVQDRQEQQGRVRTAINTAEAESYASSDDEASASDNGSRKRVNKDGVVPPGARVAPDELADALDPAERRRSTLRWIAFWIVFAIFTIVLVVLAVKKGGAKFDFKDALKKAAGGGVSGAAAMVIQVLTLMPLRTIMNYQYRYGGTTKDATKKLYNDGGFKRYYNGLLPALFQGPISRFGDTAANVGILALLSSNPFLNRLPSPIKTVFASIAGALFRMVLVPIDTFKTTMQTQGKHGVGILTDRVKAYGPGSLWWGAWATAIGNFVGSFPWFATYNWLQEIIPPRTELFPRLARQAFIGFVASVVSDTISNSLRVLKTYRQVNQSQIGYVEAGKRIVREEGWLSLLGRGLATRILANGLQGILFSVLWKVFQDLWNKKVSH